MQDTIRDLIKMDQEACAQVEEIKKQSGESKKQIIRDKEKVYETYLTRAQRRVEIIQKETQNQKELLYKKVEEQFQKASDRLDAVYKQYREEWVEEIYQNCIK